MRLLSLIGKLHLRRSVSDPALRARLAPDFLIGCKRILVSDDYLPALTKPNVEIVDGGAVRVTPTGVVGADGVERPVDVIACGTGFLVTEFTFAHVIRGRDGRTLSAPGDRVPSLTSAPRSPASPTCSSSRARTPASAIHRCC